MIDSLTGWKRSSVVRITGPEPGRRLARGRAAVDRLAPGGCRRSRRRAGCGAWPPKAAGASAEGERRQAKSAKMARIREITGYKPVRALAKQPLMLPQVQTFEVRRRPATTGWPAGR